MTIQKSLLFSLIFQGVSLLSIEAQVTINEYSVSNLNTFPDNYGEFEDWIELYNPDIIPADMGGYFLGDDTASPSRWAFPQGTLVPANGYLLIWASGRDEVSFQNYHTNFRLTQTGAEPDWIILSDPSGSVLQQIQLEITQEGHSRGRITDGDEFWGIFTDPTPEESNNTSNACTRYAARPMVSDTGGFYSGEFSVTLTTDEPGSEIRYTLDGTEPTSSSFLYNGPVSILFTRVLKARVFSNDASVLPGLIEFNTYFLNEDHALPILSVAGNELVELLNGNQELRPFGSTEFFNQSNVRTTRAYGEFNEHGQDSWVHPQRSIDYISRDECGYNNALREKFFSLSDRDEFQRIILRASGDDNYPGIDTSAHLRDDFVQTLSQRAGQHLDWRKSERIVLYANGNYWGIYAIREKVHDHDYTDYYYDQGKYDLQFIMLWGWTWAEYGGQQALNDWYDLYDYIMSHNMGNPEYFKVVSDQYDVTSLVDYVIINSYVVCSDWLNWNVGWWRGLNPTGSHRKWAYILWDEDATFGHYINYTGIPAQSPYVSPCFQDDLSGWQDPENHVQILNKLRENAEFEQYYISRYIDLLNTCFKDEFMLPMLDSMAQIIAPEMLQHTQRWGGSPEQWQSNVQRIRDFVTTRNSVIREGLAECYDLTGPFDITVTVQPEGAGQVKVNSLLLENYPWTGTYFGGIDVKLEATGINPAYEFDRWILQNHAVFPSETAPLVSLDLNQNDSIVALFKPRIFYDSLVINEINYNPADDFDPGDWVEFYNPHDYDLDITHWEFRDEDDEHSFVFPDGTVLGSKDYLVLCNDTTRFKSLFPQVENFIGNMDFGFSGNGELIRLFDASLILIDTVHYDDSAPWPIEPDGDGPTLELINPSYDNALPQSWAASSGHGTPGTVNGTYVGVPGEKPLNRITCRIYPNPFSDRAAVAINTHLDPEGALCTIFDMFGHPVKEYRLVNSWNFTVSRDGLKSGFYMFKITDRNHALLYTGKFIIL